MAKVLALKNIPLNNEYKDVPYFANFSKYNPNGSPIHVETITRDNFFVAYDSRYKVQSNYTTIKVFPFGTDLVTSIVLPITSVNLDANYLHVMLDPQDDYYCDLDEIFYFITSITQYNGSTYRLDLEMDVMSTFGYELNFGTTLMTQKKHCKRFTDYNGYALPFSKEAIYDDELTPSHTAQLIRHLEPLKFNYHNETILNNILNESMWCYAFINVQTRVDNQPFYYLSYDNFNGEFKGFSQIKFAKQVEPYYIEYPTFVGKTQYDDTSFNVITNDNLLYSKYNNRLPVNYMVLCALITPSTYEGKKVLCNEGLGVPSLMKFLNKIGTSNVLGIKISNVCPFNKDLLSSKLSYTTDSSVTGDDNSILITLDNTTYPSIKCSQFDGGYGLTEYYYPYYDSVYTFISTSANYSDSILLLNTMCVTNNGNLVNGDAIINWYDYLPTSSYNTLKTQTNKNYDLEPKLYTAPFYKQGIKFFNTSTYSFEPYLIDSSSNYLRLYKYGLTLLDNGVEAYGLRSPELRGVESIQSGMIYAINNNNDLPFFVDYYKQSMASQGNTLKTNHALELINNGIKTISSVYQGNTGGIVNNVTGLVAEGVTYQAKIDDMLNTPDNLVNGNATGIFNYSFQSHEQINPMYVTYEMPTIEKQGVYDYYYNNGYTINRMCKWSNYINYDDDELFTRSLFNYIKCNDSSIPLKITTSMPMVAKEKISDILNTGAKLWLLYNQCDTREKIKQYFLSEEYENTDLWIWRS